MFGDVSERTRQRLQVAERYERPMGVVSPARTAFLVVDMQRTFAGLWADDASRKDLEHLKNLVSIARDAGCLIVRTQHGHDDPAADGGTLHEWWRSSIIKGTPAHTFIPGFEPAAGDILIPKKRYSAFQGTPLEEILSRHGIEWVIVGGVMTNLCCETTARDAFCRDYSVIFLADGTATATEEMHRATLLNLGFGFAHVRCCGDVAALLRKNANYSEGSR